MQDTVPLGPDFEPVPPQKPKLSDIVHECGTIERLYYASTEVHHIGREDVGLPPDKQRAREQIADVAMKLLDNGIEKRIATLKQMLSVGLLTPEVIARLDTLLHDFDACNPSTESYVMLAEQMAVELGNLVACVRHDQGNS